MKWLSDTIAGRTILVLVLGLGSILGLAQYLYQTGLEREVSERNIESIVDRLIFLADNLVTIEPETRDEAAHRLSGGPLELHWGRERLATPGGHLDATAVRLKERLAEKVPRLSAPAIVFGSSRTGGASHAVDREAEDGHTILISIPLADGSWLNVTLARVVAARAAVPSALLSAILGACGIILVAILMGRWLTKPLDRLADGARRLFVAPETGLLPATGTREVRTLATAINDLQLRIHRLIDDRTQMLAAISHDLRTPLTRLRLRLAGLPDDLRKSVESDLSEMEQMIDATLAFLRDDLSTEAAAPVDLSAILETIAADAGDAGQRVELEVPRHLVITGRHLALKRALTNLVQNAVKYAGAARVSAVAAGAAVEISIEDDGPGIPEGKLDVVFEPFQRLDTSRGRSSGGHGLGLTVARSIARAHGGEVSLANRSPHGLRVIVSLPRGSVALTPPTYLAAD